MAFSYTFIKFKEVKMKNETYNITTLGVGFFINMLLSVFVGSIIQSFKAGLFLFLCFSVIISAEYFLKNFFERKKGYAYFVSLIIAILLGLLFFYLFLQEFIKLTQI